MSAKTPEKTLDQTITDLNKLVANPKDGGSKSNLWYSWQFLQVYSTWGIKIPNTEASLSDLLNIKDTASFLWFKTMLEAHTGIHSACNNFLVNIFPEVIGIGNNLLNFTSNALPDNYDSSAGGEYDLLIQTLTPGNDNYDGTGETALELIEDLQSTIKANVAHVKDVATSLASYKVTLTNAEAKVVQTRTQIKADSKVNEDNLNKLAGGKDVTGSIKQLTELVTTDNDTYKHDVVIATTTVTYAWVAPPFGLIAAGVVAGVYGDRAVKALKAYNEALDELTKAEDDQSTAITVQRVQSGAEASLSQIQRYTDLAIRHATEVQNVWNTLHNNLDVVCGKTNKMTREQKKKAVLKSKILVKNYAKHASNSWKALLKPLKELTKKPYINVDKAEMSLMGLQTVVEETLAVAKKAS